MFRGWIHIFLVKWLLPPTETYFGGQNIFAIRWQLTPDYNLGRWQSLGKEAWQDSQGTSTPGNNLQGRNCMIIQNVQIVHLPKQTYHKIFAQWMLIFDTCRVVTMVIFGGSVLHHALNAQQFIYSYAPHKPTSLSRCCQELPWRYRFLAWLLRSSPISNLTFRWMPPPGKDISWQWIKDALPSLKQQETLYFTVLIIIIIFKFNKSKVQRCWWV